ncbi:MAG: hypothetical protein WBO35_04580 [Candidatus Saccharimonadales bacterium]
MGLLGKIGYADGIRSLGDRHARRRTRTALSGGSPVLHWTAAGRNHYSPWFHRFGIRLERIRTVDDLETARRICASGFQDH